MRKLYIRSREPKLFLSQYQEVGVKPGGMTKGAIYRSLDKEDIDKYLIKKPPDPNTAINNFVASCIYKRILGFQGSEDEIVIDDQSLMIKSRMFSSFQTAPSENWQLAAKGVDKVIAARMFFWDGDLTKYDNYGLIPSQDGYYFVAIDHEYVRLDELDNQLSHYQNIIGSFLKYGKDLRTIDFANACEEIGRTKPQHIDFHVQYIVDYLRFVLEKLSPDVACKLAMRSLCFIRKESNTNTELLLYLQNSQNDRGMNENEKFILHDCLFQTPNIVEAIQLVSKESSQFSTEHIEILLGLYQAALELAIKKGVVQMQELSNIIRLRIAINMDDFDEFRQILHVNPDLLINSERDEDNGNTNERVLDFIFGALSFCVEEKRCRFFNVLHELLKEKPEFIRILNLWNSINKIQMSTITAPSEDDETKNLKF